MILALLGCAGAPTDDTAAAPLPDILAGFAVGDEVVAGLAPTSVGGDWADADDPGAVVELQLGENLARHVVLPGGVDAPQFVALGAWDGGALRVETVEGDAAWALQVRADPDAARVPVVGLRTDDWTDDVPLLVYEDDGHWTWVFTNEDGGYGLLPTLLVAQYGRPVDIEGLYDEGGPEVQTTDHAWVPFGGPYEGAHPLLQVVTDNGMLGPLAEATWRLSPMPVDFSAEGVPRERVLDAEGWLLATSFAEEAREGWLTEDGGQDDRELGAPADYLFLDYELSGDVRVAFEARVDGAWWSSTNGLATEEGLTDARLTAGVGRTAIELPPGAAAEDVDGLRVVSYEGEGQVSAARWFALDDAFAPVEAGAAAGIGFGAGETVALWEE